MEQWSIQYTLFRSQQLIVHARWILVEEDYLVFAA